MKIYLVGGAVRDELLGLPVKERDWVVVGATPEQLIGQGYCQVGRGFPVFIHPQTHEEYALARTERKSSRGYYGFECSFDSQVTLEDDLLRRDLTINAMAKDANGKIIDPYHGQADLQSKILRHVSPAFCEDPVRVLRVARFAARYFHLGFTLADETRALMYAMVKQGELETLVAERVWQEWQRSLEEQNPEIFITTLRSCGALDVVLPEIAQLFGVPNPQQHHPEIDSGIHSLLVLQAAVRLSSEPSVRFAALLHDVGKALTPIEEWPKHHGHEERGVKSIEALCRRLRIPNAYCDLAVKVSKFHLLIHRVTELKASTVVSLLEQLDVFRRPQRFEKLLLACEADAQGCLRTMSYTQARLWLKICCECAKFSGQMFISKGYEGKAIKEALHQERIACTHSILTSWKHNEK